MSALTTFVVTTLFVSVADITWDFPPGKWSIRRRQEYGANAMNNS